MKILQLCNRLPFPLKDGFSIVSYNFTKGCKKLGHDVTILAMNTSKHYLDTDKLPKELSELATIYTNDVNNKISIWKALINLFSNRSYHVERFISKGFNEKLVSILQKETYDIVHMEGLFVSPYLETVREYSDAKVVLRTHNVEHQIWERLSHKAHGLKKWYLALLAKRLKKYERSVANNFDLLVTLTEDDKELFAKGGCTIPMHVSTAGLDLDRYSSTGINMEYPSLFFLGSLEWMPNQEGLRWFLAKIWPLVHQTFPNLTLYIAGRNPPAWVENIAAPNIEVVGEVENSIAFMESKAIMVVPLLSGSGMRIKILEALAMKRPVISTTLGAEGFTSGSDMVPLIADNGEAFVSQITKCVTDKDFYERVSEHGYEWVKAHYQNHEIVRSLLEQYRIISEKEKSIDLASRPN